MSYFFPTTFNKFPTQRVSGAEKRKSKWYANSIDYIISMGIASNDRTEDELELSILRGNIPDSFYKKTLNPYNASKEKYTRFPATMRNYDIVSDIIRRYVSEYFKGIHQFVVGAENPDIVINKDAALKQTIMQAAEQAFQQEFQKRYQQMLNQAQQQGQDPNQVDPSQAMPDVEEFMNKFNQDYIDKESKQGQDVLNYVRAMTEDNLIYLTCYFHFVALGECFTYCDVRGNKIVKDYIPVTEAYPIPNANFFVEDHDMFARKMMMSYQQIVDMFDDFLDEKDRKFLETYYAHQNANSGVTRLSYNQYFENYPDICSKFSNEERDLFRKEPVSIYEVNDNLYEVWHVVWRGEARRGILTYINEVGMQATRVVDEDYQLNPEAGDIDIEWAYEPQVYEGYRIGNRYTAIYPIKARPVAFNRNGKLPYNGIMEILPYMGKFDIIKIVTPYQVMRNIISYHREMVIAKNKMLILMMPQSLIQDDSEDKVYRMAADGILLVDDSEDTNSQKMAQVRLLNANMGQYITELTNLMESIKLEARELVDMNAQRYGQIAQSAGATNTQQAISQSAMGSVIINQMFDEFRKRDYNRDIDYAKLAYIDGLDTAYWDEVGKRQFISLDVSSFVNSDYSVTVRNDAKEIDKLQQLRQWAFSAAQNGDLEMAIAAITGDNVSQIKNIVNRFADIKRKHEEDMQRMEQMIKQEEVENKLREIAAKGEQDRLTKELQYQYELQLKYIDVDMSMISSTPDNSDDLALKERIANMTEESKRRIEDAKLNIERQKLIADTYNAAAEREVKREQMKTDLQIAKTNKNRYDK